MLKSFLYSRFNPFPCILPLQSAISLTRQRLILLVYHTTCNEVPDILRHLYRPRTVKLFEDDLDFLLRYYEPIDLHGLKKIVIGHENLSKNSFMVTFDDGLSGFYSHAAPVLLKKGVPATCFLNTAFVDNRDMFYRYKVSVLIEAMQKHKEKREFWQQFHALKEKYGIPQGYYRNVLLRLDYRHLAFIEEAAALAGLDFKAYLQSYQPYMTSEQISGLVHKGFTFGGHGIDHADFDLLPEEEQVRQACQSTKEVADRFGLPYRVFSFPFTDFGIKKSFFDTVFTDNQVELTFGTAGLKKDSEHRNLQRIPMEDYDISAERRLKADYFYYLLKGLIGKNVIIRQ